MLRLIDSINVNNILGEGVIWHTQSQTVWWTDIEQKKLFSYHIKQKKLAIYHTPYRLCSFGFTSQNNIMITAFDRGIALYNYKTQALNWLFTLPSQSPIRFNDGRVDTRGRFWVGTMNEHHPENRDGSLYRVLSDLSVQEIARDIGIANGISWNNKATKFYLADSIRQTIFQYDFDNDNAEIGNQQIYAHTAENALPDGAIIDNKDNLWSAHWGGSSIVRYSAKGHQTKYDMPVSQPTCVAFGGSNNDLLFVTTANCGLSEKQKIQQPLAGSLLIFKSEYTGNGSHLFSYY